MKSAPGLKATLSCRLAFSALLPLLLVCGFVLNHIRVSALEATEAESLAFAKNIASQVDLYLEVPAALLGNGGSLTKKIAPGEISDALDGLLEMSPSHGGPFETVFLLDRKGKVQAVGLPPARRQTREELTGLEFGHLEVFREAGKLGRPVWSDTFFSVVSGAHSIALCVPVNGSFLLGHVKIDKLSEFITEHSPRGALTVVLDNKGEDIARNMSAPKNKIFDFSAIRIVRDGLKGVQGTGRFTLIDSEHLGSVVRVEGPGWIVLTSTPVSVALAPLHSTIRYFVAGIVLTLALAVLFSHAQAKKLAAPLTALAEDATRLAEGDFYLGNARQPYRESQALYDSFRRMSGSLRAREESLVNAERNLRHLLESINAAPWEYDIDADRYTYIGPQLERFLGGKVDWRTSSDWLASVHPDDREAVKATSWMNASKMADYESVYRLCAEGGQSIRVREIVTPNAMAGEGRRLLAGVILDMTAEVAMQERNAALQKQVAQTQRLDALGTLAGGIAHDFNNILSAILGYTEIARMKLPEGSEISQDLGQVLAASDRAKSLVAQILSYSRMRQQDRIPVECGAIVRESLRFLRATLPADISIVSRVQTQGMVLADPGQLSQVVMNLCTNAGKAMPGGGTLTVTLRAENVTGGSRAARGQIKSGRYVLLTVEDTGVGIPPELVDRIFEPFFTTRMNEGGTGLGLSVVYGVVTEMGGALDVTSEPGKGSKFSVWMPEHSGGGEGGSEALYLNDVRSGKGERLLVVDDEEALAALYAAVLQKIGYDVTTATGSVEAMELFARDPYAFDLVLTDMTMPGLTGDVLIERMKTLRPDVRAILCTGFSERLSEARLSALGVEAMLMKPISVATLGAAIRSALSGKG